MANLTVASLTRLIANVSSVRTNVHLGAMSSWRIGGLADVFVTPNSIEEVIEIIKFLSNAEIPWIVIGHTTNLLFADEGIRGVVIQLGSNISAISIKDGKVIADAGIWVPHFASKVGNMGLTGAEHTIGIPGTLGGIVCMNGGSMRQSIGDHLHSALCVSRCGDLLDLHNSDCEFGYRRSRIQDEGWIVLRAVFHYPRGNRRDIRRQMCAILRERRLKFPRKIPNCGSVFVSDPEMYPMFGPPGSVIERLGLKGFRIGDAEISPMHANFIVNRGKARAADIVQVIHHVRELALARLGCNLRCEVRYVDSLGNVYPAHMVIPTSETTSQRCIR